MTAREFRKRLGSFGETITTCFELTEAGTWSSTALRTPAQALPAIVMTELGIQHQAQRSGRRKRWISLTLALLHEAKKTAASG